MGHTRLMLSRYHISVLVRSDHYVISVQRPPPCCPACVPRFARLYLDLSSQRINPYKLFGAQGDTFLPHSFLHTVILHLSSLTYLVSPRSALETARNLYSTPLFSFLSRLSSTRSIKEPSLSISHRPLESPFPSTVADTPPRSFPPSCWPRLVF